MDSNESQSRWGEMKEQNLPKNNLIQIKVDKINWRVLWQDPITNQYWKEFFSRPELQAGGPSVFIKISEDEAKSEFDLKL